MHIRHGLALLAAAAPLAFASPALADHHHHDYGYRGYRGPAARVVVTPFGGHGARPYGGGPVMVGPQYRHYDGYGRGYHRDYDRGYYHGDHGRYYRGSPHGVYYYGR